LLLVTTVALTLFLHLLFTTQETVAAPAAAAAEKEEAVEKTKKEAEEKEKEEAAKTEAPRKRPLNLVQPGGCESLVPPGWCRRYQIEYSGL
jgi:hypothetical protein